MDWFPTVMVCLVYPTDENIKTDSGLGTFIVKLPFISETTPVLLPSNIMFTPGNAPSIEDTVPVIFNSWAFSWNESEVINDRIKNNLWK